MSSFRRRMMVANSKPYDAEIEYLQSDGKQYINTGLYGDNSTKVELKEEHVGGSTLGLFGGRNTDNTSNIFALYIITSGRNVQFGFNATSNSTNATYNTAHIHIADKNGLYVDGTKKITLSDDGTFTTDDTMLLFTTRTGDGHTVESRMFKGKIYYCKIWNGNVLVADMIPVKKDGVGYMYDKVSGQLFGNSGTRSFILGNEVN